MLRVPKEICDTIEPMHLASHPHILLRFHELAEDGCTNVDDLATLAGQDPALSSQILTVANAIAVRQGKPPSICLVQCLLLLGARLIKILAACLIVKKHFNKTDALARYNLNGFWGHSLLVAEMCRLLAEETWYPDADEAYLAGLLHDSGQLLLIDAVAEQYESLMALCCDEQPLYSLEKYRLQTDHAAVGAWMVEQWNIPATFLADAILFHHVDAEKILSADRLSRIVWSAHQICYHNAPLKTGQSVSAPELAIVRTLLDIDRNRAAALYEQCLGKVLAVAESLRIDCTEETIAASLHQPCTVPASVKKDIPEVISLLGDQVRDMALMQSFQYDLASVESEAELLSGIREAIRILLGLVPVVFLFSSPDKTRLVSAENDFQSSLLQHLDIHLDTSHSCVAAVAIDKTPRCEFFSDADRPDQSLVDLQIARILSSDGLQYLPLVNLGSTFGVMVCGLPAHTEGLFKKLTLFGELARVIAAAIVTWRNQQNLIDTRQERLISTFENHVARITHEAGNPLATIKNYLNVIAQKSPADSCFQHEMEALREEIERVTTLLKKKARFNDLEAPARSLDVNLVIQSLLVIYEETLFSSRGIDVKLELDEGLPLITCDRDPLKQIFFNIWNNASDAMEAGGVLSVSTSRCVGQDGSGYIEVRMSDTGPGISPDVMDRLFKPLDSNRRPGRSGVGLSIVAALVGSLDGRITCQSKPGQGTLFSILLPIHGRKQQ